MLLLSIAALGEIGGALVAQEPSSRGTESTALTEAARSHVRARWEKDVRPFSESALNKIDVQAVERRNRLAPGHEIHLVHAFAEAAWWKASEHHLLLIRSGSSGFEVLYGFRGGAAGGGIGYRLIDLGSGQRRFALEISDRGFDGAAGTATILVLYLPEGDRFAEVFREVTTYRPAESHTFASQLAYRGAEGPMKHVVARTELFKAGEPVEAVEAIFEWQGSSYAGIMPLPPSWRAQLP